MLDTHSLFQQTSPPSSPNQAKGGEITDRHSRSRIRDPGQGARGMEERISILLDKTKRICKTEIVKKIVQKIVPTTKDEF